MTTEEFIRENADGDIRALALKHAGRTDIDLAYALDQIAGRRKARTKLPRWAAHDGIIYPPHISMEQCSSEQTARYKATVAARLLNELHCNPSTALHNPTTGNQITENPDNLITPQPSNPTTLIDLTGGFGVDFSYMAPLFDRAVYIERQSHLCDVSRHNMTELGITQAEVICGDCEQIIEATTHADMIYADPARRDSHGGRTFAIADCTPDLLSMKDMLLEKASYVMIKLSPMLDWRKAAADMGVHVGEVHIVAVGNECKELLLVMSARYTGLSRIYCVNDGNTFTFTPDEAASAVAAGGTTAGDDGAEGQPPAYLYEPNAALMKAGCFALTARRYGVRQISRDSHLYVSHEKTDRFPGRTFAIRAVTTMNKRELKAALAGTERANVSVRNFPLSADALRRKLRLKDGGDTYIFGTTTADGRHVLFICTKDMPADNKTDAF